MSEGGHDPAAVRTRRCSPHPRPPVVHRRRDLPGIDNLRGANDAALIAVCLVLPITPKTRPARSPLAKCARWACAACWSTAPTTAAATPLPSAPIGGPMTSGCPTSRAASPVPPAAGAARMFGPTSAAGSDRHRLLLNHPRLPQGRPAKREPTGYPNFSSASLAWCPRLASGGTAGPRRHDRGNIQSHDSVATLRGNAF